MEKRQPGPTQKISARSITASQSSKAESENENSEVEEGPSVNTGAVLKYHRQKLVDERLIEKAKAEYRKTLMGLSLSAEAAEKELDGIGKSHCSTG